MKIKNITIKGIRGVKNNCILDLDEDSILLYGDSGAGKSSITDVIEWFFQDKVEHLSSLEIGRKGGQEALRNILTDKDQEASAGIYFSDKKLNSDKIINDKNGSYSTSYTNETKEFKDLLNEIQKENIILRHQDLISFVLATKKERLEELSNIIGFTEVTKIRDVLRRSVNSIKSELKIKNFNTQISTKQSNLIEYLGSNIISESQLVEAINELLTQLKIKKSLKSISEINEVLKLIETPDDSKVITLQSFYLNIRDFSINFSESLKKIEELYSIYFEQFRKIAEDIEKVKKIVLDNLLQEGKKVLEMGVIDKDYCPLCLQMKDRGALLNEISDRIVELKICKEENLKLLDTRKQLNSFIINNINKIEDFISDEKLDKEEDEELKKLLVKLLTYLKDCNIEIQKNVLENNKIKNLQELQADENIFNKIKSYCNKRNAELEVIRPDQEKFKIYSNIERSRDAYKEIKDLEKERLIYEKQINSLEKIYKEFIKKQKDGLDLFLSNFSNNVNDLYGFMNPGEKVENIQFVPIEKNGELMGITLKLNFLDKEVMPPQKYLSESHLNCLGIAFFLTSVKAFNKKSDFIILDDVISSFDTNHRTRFANLLVEKLSDYQIILLTHEKNWYEYIRNLIKGKEWKVGSLNWTEKEGTCLIEPLENIKERIERKIATNKKESLGNDIRKYLEHILKLIAFNIETKVNFQFNNSNEERMSNELLTSIKSKINKQPCEQLKRNNILDRLIGSIFIGTKDSHDSTFSPSMGDFKAFWNDVEELESLFYCNSCKKYLSSKYFNKSSKKIRCGCSNGLCYDWKM
jgi:energy-coupling factor transporter ATP-binding protein EcfA2